MITFIEKLTNLKYEMPIASRGRDIESFSDFAGKLDPTEKTHRKIQYLGLGSLLSSHILNLLVSQ